MVHFHKHGMIVFHKDGTIPEPKIGTIFVFGSNDKGIHGIGAAKAAVEKFGATRGKPEGRQGNSYAIPTRVATWITDEKRWHMRTMNLADIQDNVSHFIYVAERADPRYLFFVTRIGCGFAGVRDEKIAPMFKGVKGKFSFAEQWKEYIL